MNINIHLIVLLTISSNFASYAQNAYSGVQSVQLTDGYYQTIDLNPETACRCEKKTERTFSLNKGLVQYDVLNYKLHAYKFSFGNSNVPVSKLFKAMDDDLTIYKISMK